MANVDNPEKTRRMAHAASAGRSVICKVLLLDGTTYDIDVDKKAIGLVLYDKVCTHLDLLEKDYFGLNFIDMKTNLTSWLNLEKRISKQMKDHAWHFNFEVKFYPTDVHQLHEDLTRYQLCLQIRRDIVSEKLPCSFVTYSLLGSYTVQSELGDWEMEEFGPGIDYIKDMRFAPSQDRDLLKKIVELHKTHKGQTPEEAELHFLDNAKKLALYGVDLHDAKDGEGVDIQIGVCAGGIMIYKDKLQISRFVWPKVVKMSYRRNKFYIKLRPGEFEDFQSMIAFKLLSIRHAKRIWKISVEHHSFFRFKEAEIPRKRGLLKLGSKFRYSGRTLYQSKMVVSAVDRPMPNFDRIHSKRATYGGRPNKRPVDDYYSRPIREPRTAPSKPPKPPKPEVPQEHYIDRHPEDNVPHVDRNQPDHEEYEDEDPIETKHRMEKMHAVPTPLALITQNKDKDKDQKENNNGQPQNMESGDEHTPEPRRVNRRDDYRPDSEDEMERPIDIPLNHAAPHIEPVQETPFKLLSKEEQKRQQKEEKERIKRAKEEDKRRKKEEEKERKRIEKERKSKKGKEKIGQEWDQAVHTAVRTEVTLPPPDDSPERPKKRLSSFEEKRVSSLNEEHLLSEGDPDDVPSDKETHVADDDIDDPPENKEVNQARVGEEFEL